MKNTLVARLTRLTLDPILWKRNTDEEIGAFTENKTFLLVPYPEYRRSGGEWLYAINSGSEKWKKYKASKWMLSDPWCLLPKC